MRSIVNFLTNPILFGLAGVAMLAAAHYFYPQYTSFAIIVFFVWAVAVGLNYAFGGSDDPGETEVS